MFVCGDSLCRQKQQKCEIVYSNNNYNMTIILIYHHHHHHHHSKITYKLVCFIYNSLTTGHPGYLRSLINYYITAILYDQLTNFFLIVHGSLLNLAKDPSPTLHPQSGMICLLIQGSPPLLIPLSAVTRQSSLHSLPALPT